MGVTLGRSRPISGIDLGEGDRVNISAGDESGTRERETVAHFFGGNPNVSCEEGSDMTSIAECFEGRLLDALLEYFDDLADGLREAGLVRFTYSRELGWVTFWRRVWRATGLRRHR